MLLVLCLAAASANAETITLRNEATLDGQVLETSDDAVVIRVPREDVATIDGAPLPPVLDEGVAAPTFTAKDLAGISHTVDAKQNKVTVLHFWVSWCPYCQTDAPEVAKLHEQFRENPNVRVLTISLDRDRANLDQFMKERAVSYPVISAADVAEAQGGFDLTDLYQVTGFPITYVIDPQGIIRHKVRGSFAKQGLNLGELATALIPAPESKAKTEHTPRRPKMRVARLP